MAYTLQAFILGMGPPMVLPAGLRTVALPCRLEMIPLDGQARQALELPFLPLTDEGSDGVPLPIIEMGRVLSESRKLAYIEAEYFGGQGSQASLQFAMGLLVDPPQLNADAINQALRWLGVHCANELDEFDTVRLGVHRNTENWQQRADPKPEAATSLPDPKGQDGPQPPVRFLDHPFSAIDVTVSLPEDVLLAGLTWPTER